MQELIPIVNQLQAVLTAANLQHTFSLPQIVVVGAQSSGKSSVLESLVGRDFLPRGTSIVTRCPLRLQLIRSTDNPSEFGVFSHTETIFNDFEEIRREIRRVTDKIAGSGKNISTKPIELAVYSPNVLDITLIDLPGIVKVPVGDQPHDIARTINSMILEYIRNPSTIIMAISAANNDLANSDALQMAREVDPQGERTVGVLTKIDIMDFGANAMDMLSNRVYPLKLGHVGVVCRSQYDIDSQLPMAEHLTREQRFFQSHPEYASIAHRCGISFLGKKLNELLINHIKRTLPQLQTEIKAYLSGAEAELRRLGPSAIEGLDQSSLILEVIRGVTKGFKDMLEGKVRKKATEELQGGARINHIFAKVFHKKIETIEPLYQLTDQKILTAIINATGPKGVLFVPEAAFEVLIKRQIKLLRAPSHECLLSVTDELKDIVYRLDIPEFQRFNRLHEAVAEIVTKLIQKAFTPTEELIETLIDIELSFINTNHPDFVQGEAALDRARAQAREGTVPLEKHEHPNRERAVLVSSDMKAPLKPSSKQLFETTLIKILIESYFGIVKKSVLDAVPKAIVCCLIDHVTENINSALVHELYHDQANFEFLLEESPEIVNKRTLCTDAVESLRKALDILNKTSNVSFL